MNQTEKTNLTNLGKNQKFNNVMEKLTKNIHSIAYKHELIFDNC